MPYHAVPYVCCIALHECVLQKMLCASHVDVVLLRFVLFRVNFAFISTCKKWNIILWAKNLYSRNGFCELFLFSFCVWAMCVRMQKYTNLSFTNQKCFQKSVDFHKTCAIFSSLQLRMEFLPRILLQKFRLAKYEQMKLVVIVSQLKLFTNEQNTIVCLNPGDSYNLFQFSSVREFVTKL